MIDSRIWHIGISKETDKFSYDQLSNTGKKVLLDLTAAFDTVDHQIFFHVWLSVQKFREQSWLGLSPVCQTRASLQM